MFTLTQTPVKFVVLLLLFAWCTLWCGYELTKAGPWRERVSAALHLLMAVVMLLMVAPPTWQALVAVVPTAAWAVVFGVAALWFAWWAVPAFRRADRAEGWHLVGHATMFVAMAWHLAAMASMASMHRAGDHHGMGHDGMGGHAMNAGPGPMWWFAVAGVPLMTYLLLMGGWSLGATARRRRDPRSALAEATPSELAAGHACAPHRPVGTTGYRLAMASDAAMNLGMFWMSTGLLVPLIPAMQVLAF